MKDLFAKEEQNPTKKLGIFLSEDNLARLENIFYSKVIEKDQFFLRAGEYSTELALVQRGLFRSFYIDQNGNDITKYFYPQESMLFSYAAYLTRQTSQYSIQALEDSEILAARISDFDEVVRDSSELLVLYKTILDENLIMKEEHASSFKLLNNVQRYQKFLTQYPGLEKRIKQHQLASYLGITPVSLSRIRSRLRLNK